MAEVRLIKVREELLAENRQEAGDIRAELRRHGVFMLNLMSSPGSGKTSLILRTVRALKNVFRIAVIEGDIDAMVDAEKVVREGIPAVQIRTGGACHLDAPMIAAALKELDLAALDCIIIENVGNLVCPAEFDTGAARRAVILSVPEGDDKPLKYPLIFSVSDLLIINKTDYLEGSDFDPEALRERAIRLNPGIRILPLSCRTGEGVDAWLRWLAGEIEAFRNRWEKETFEIGCGLCVTACPTEALSLVLRELVPEIPATSQEMGMKVLTEKGKLEAFLLASKR